MTGKIPTRHRAAGHRAASAIITAELAAVDFPVKKEDLADQVGDRPVELADGVVMPLREMLKLVPQREFKTPAQAMDAIDSRWKEFRAAAEGEPTEGERNE